MSFQAKRRDPWPSLEDAFALAALVGTAGFALAMMSRSVAVASFHALLRGRRGERS